LLPLQCSDFRLQSEAQLGHPPNWETDEYTVNPRLQPSDKAFKAKPNSCREESENPLDQ
jgi:hypothetical protein